MKPCSLHENLNFIHNADSHDVYMVRDHIAIIRNEEIKNDRSVPVSAV